MSDRKKEINPEDVSGVITKTRSETKKPSMYKVLLLNDDFTPMEFVILVLQRFFSMSNQKASEVMLHVHRRGVGVCGVFTFEVAETKMNQVINFSKRNEHPLQCTMEKD
ncbi:MAG: ATP-dependent Clp protease adapter ClpS [Gammaproteobacteria bacterium]|nr:ATP-dependent Clp protease adapter ClpS [Gammaproteobacteria bacterium]|tara:strand:- start:979 stop:1305 length:327 start_codon:yes stop_codon:yes gene_type:complete